MHRLGFIFLEDPKNESSISKNNKFWKLDVSLISKKLIISTLKSNYNLLIRLENYLWLNKKFFKSLSVYNFHKHNKTYIFFERANIINNAIRRNDEILSLLNS